MLESASFLSDSPVSLMTWDGFRSRSAMLSIDAIGTSFMPHDYSAPAISMSLNPSGTICVQITVGDLPLRIISTL